jgi:hypothetical protein
MKHKIKIGGMILGAFLLGLGTLTVMAFAPNQTCSGGQFVNAVSSTGSINCGTPAAGGTGTVTTSSALTSGLWVVGAGDPAIQTTSSQPVLTVNASGTVIQIGSISASGAISLGVSQFLSNYTNNAGFITSTTNVSSTNIDVSNRLNVTNSLTIPNNTTPSSTGEIGTENTSSSLLTFHDGSALNALSPYYKCFDWTIFNASTTADTQDYVTTIYNTSTLVALYPLSIASGTMQYNLEWNMSSASTTAQDSHAFTATSTVNNTTSTPGGISPTGSSTIPSGAAIFFTASGPSVSSTQFGLTGICKVTP